MTPVSLPQWGKGDRRRRWMRCQFYVEINHYHDIFFVLARNVLFTNKTWKKDLYLPIFYVLYSSKSVFLFFYQ